MPLKRALMILGVVVLVLSCQPEPNEPAARVATEVVREPREVVLYFESSKLRLEPEKRSMELPDKDYEAAGPLLQALLRGSEDPDVPRTFPDDAVVLAVYFLPQGLVVVDLGGPTLSQGWNTGSHTEMMAVYSLIQTLVSNFDGVSSVRILISGQPAQTLAGHIAIDHFLRPNPSLVAAE